MPYGEAAQAVQVSDFPDRYATREQEAREIAAAAGIDLTRLATPMPDAQAQFRRGLGTMVSITRSAEEGWSPVVSRSTASGLRSSRRSLTQRVRADW